MNNRTNAMKKRADTLADYIIRRCEDLEEENHRMSIRAITVDNNLKKYGDAFCETLKKIEGIERLDDGSILIKFIAEDGAKMSQIIPITGFLHPIAKLLFEKSNLWRIRR